MNRLPAVLAALGLSACAANLGGPKAIDTTTVAVRVDPGVDAAAVAAALEQADARVAFVAAPRDAEWFRTVAAATRHQLSGPASMDDVELVFLGPEPLGDTTLVIPYDDGDLPIHDALYEIEEGRLLDLLAFRIDDPAHVRGAVAALLEYVATDVDNAAALVLAALVPTAAVGDSVARMLSPAYYDAVRCETGAAAPSEKEGIRLFYGPQARMYCDDATTSAGEIGEWVSAELVMGRR
ncbi:MAG: hypothetical protein ACLFRX_09105 [Gemmatimonadota bacterium]